MLTGRLRVTICEEWPIYEAWHLSSIQVMRIGECGKRPHATGWNRSNTAERYFTTLHRWTHQRTKFYDTDYEQLTIAIYLNSLQCRSPQSAANNQFISLRKRCRSCLSTTPPLLPTISRSQLQCPLPLWSRSLECLTNQLQKFLYAWKKKNLINWNKK